MGEPNQRDLKPVIDRSAPIEQQLAAIQGWIDRNTAAAAEAEEFFRERRLALDESRVLMNEILTDLKGELQAAMNSKKAVDSAREPGQN
jgi:hypothetical protein